MAISSGTRLGPYEIQAAIGAGGMGEVYKARDTRLDRSVAVKVLATAIASDPALRARFEREARAVAALDHPHICGVYDVGEDGGRHYFVMPHLDGQTLAERLRKGPLPLAQALEIVTAIADALDKAHRNGIIHRDLKPANVMLTKAGPKLLDFGLAKLTAPSTPISMTAMTNMATEAVRTDRGMILGTVQYMAPEQVEGREADARTDIWAIGTLLYEMVTGTRPFAGDTPASIIGSILKDDPPRLSTRVPLVPRGLDHVVDLCLAKDPDRRWQSASDVAREAEWIAQSMREPGGAVAEVATGQRRTKVLAFAGLSAAVFLAGGATAWRFLTPAVVPPATVRFTIAPPADTTLSPSPVAAAAQLAFSPDGTSIAMVAAGSRGASQIWIHSLQLGVAQRLPGTDGASFPFWAPDSRSIGFFGAGKLKRIDIGDAAPQVLADAPNGRGGTWNADGTILFTPSPNTSISRVSALGGPASIETELSRDRLEITHYWPQFLPDGRHFLYYQRSETEEYQGIYVRTLGANDAKRVLATYGMAVYSGGRLLFIRDATLFAVDFDVDALEVTSPPVRVSGAENIGYFGGTLGYVALSASQAGALAFGPRVVMTTSLQWHDTKGGLASTVTAPGVFRSPRLSPDGNNVAVAMFSESQDPDIWMIQLSGGGRSRVTSDPRNDWFPVWSSDGRRLFFSSTRVGSSTLFQKEPSATGNGEQVLPTRFSGVYPSDASPDGKYVIEHEVTGASGYDIGIVPLEAPDQASSFLSTRFNEVQARFAPNGRWVAYASDESGRFEIYVRPFPSAPGQWPISVDGGTQPEWRRDGRELFFVSGDGTLMAADVSTDGPTFVARPARKLFPLDIPENVAPYPTDYAASADGQRFLINTIVDQTVRPALSVILNWAAELGPH